ncbi:Protein transport protein [Triplophysa tibetana]|uniref:Protein transport protein n=1 Tax=Triplophysa tibetana TaxID=1572043 RepID=A0A5A9PHC2_9TELE|nr:Protein transport protein [Triplophysa tibetana]
MTELSGPYLNDSGNIRAGAGPCDSVENLECVPNQEVLPSEPPPSHAFEVGPTSRHLTLLLVLPALQAFHPATAMSVTAVDTVLTAAAMPLGDTKIDSNPAVETSPTFPTPSPPKPVGVFQASANSSFEPVRSQGVGVRPAEVDRARMVVEKGGRDVQHGNLEQPPDNLETIYLPERRPSSRAQGARRPSESPATTLWAQNDPATLGANILLALQRPYSLQHSSQRILKKSSSPQRMALLICIQLNQTHSFPRKTWRTHQTLRQV